MPTTRQNISLIQYRLSKYARSEIMAVLDEIQTIVYSSNVQQTEYVDSTTGLPPFIATTDGVYEYDCPANCRETIAVFSDSPISTYSKSRPSPQSGRYYYNTKGYYQSAVSSRDALVGTRATVTFQENPGTTTDKFYHNFYTQPTPIDTEDDQLTIPPQHHFRMRQGVIAMLSSEEYGQTGFDTDVIDKMTRAIRNQLNRGAQARTHRTPVQDEMQQFPESTRGYYI